MIEYPFVSIILPTYNVEKYLHQCLKSIESQTYHHYEVIIVIDGATDHSYDIAKDYAARHNYVSVYWQENAGSGPARNNGLNHATGDFVIFIDPDDWIEPDYIEQMLAIQKTTEADFVTTYANFVYYDKNEKNIGQKKVHAIPVVYQNKTEVRNNYLNLFNNNMISAPTRILYRMSLIKLHDIKFPDLRRSQDIVFNYRYYNYINKLAVSDYSGYNYRILVADRMNRIKPDYYKIIELLYLEIEELHKKWKIFFDSKLAATAFFVYVYSAIEANVIRKQSINEMIKSSIVNKIITNARPKQKNKIIAHQLLKNGHIQTLVLYIRLLYFIKNKFI